MNISGFEKLLIKFAGGDLSILDRDKVPIEYNKFVGIGMSVLLTAIYASFAMGYAISWVFQDDVEAIITVAIFWGLAIFNLDRFIVSTTYKKESFQISDFIALISRIVLVYIIAATISIPLEIKFFEKSLINIVNKEKRSLIDNNEELRRLNQEGNVINTQAREEAAGKGMSGRYGQGAAYRADTAQANQKFREADKLKRSLIEQATREQLDFLSLYRALQQYKEADDDVEGIANAIFWLLLIFEITPIIIKFTLSKGIYDDHINAMIIEAQLKIKYNLSKVIASYPSINHMSIPKFEEGNSQWGKAISDFIKNNIIQLAFSIIAAVMAYAIFGTWEVPSIASIAGYFFGNIYNNLSTNNQA